VILKIKQMLIKEFNNVKIYLSERSAKLTIMTKIQERAEKKEKAR